MKKSSRIIGCMDPELFRNLAKIGKQFSETIQKTALFNEQLLETIKQARENAIRLQELVTPVIKQFEETKNWLAKLDKAGLTPNLGENRSHRKVKSYKKLLRMGYAIFWIPRAEVVQELLDAENEAKRKRVIKDHKKEIIEDCNAVLANITSKYLKNIKEHLLASIQSLDENNYRSAQSTAAIAFDAMLDSIIDSSSLPSYRQLSKKVADDIGGLSDINELPIQYFYAALQSQLVTYSLRGFERLRPQTVQTKFGRHSSVHSVSARQYNEFNAIQSIMIAVSLLATTEKLGAGWISELADLLRRLNSTSS